MIVLAERLRFFREQVGLPPDPDLVMPYRYLDLWPFPRSFRVGPYPSPTCRPTRPVPFDQSGAETFPAWIDDLPPRDQVPRVYVTLGTAGSPERRAGAFAPVLPGLGDEPLSVIVTVNRDVDPARFGPQPANVHLEQYIPQSLLLPHCDLVVCHGGSGTMISALGHGIPQVIIPFHADQPDNARAGAAAGYAIVVPPKELTPDAIRSAVRILLDDPVYRMKARRIQAEIHPMAGPEQVVGWFERLARERLPVGVWSDDVN